MFVRAGARSFASVYAAPYAYVHRGMLIVSYGTPGGRLYSADDPLLPHLSHHAGILYALYDGATDIALSQSAFVTHHAYAKGSRAQQMRAHDTHLRFEYI